MIEAAKMKREGVLAGVLDLQMLVARSGRNGFFLEMKWKYNKLTDNQIRFIEMATKQNFYCCCAWTMERGLELIERYLADEAIEGESRLQKQQSRKLTQRQQLARLSG